MSTDRIDKLTRLLEIDPDDTFCLYGLAHEYGKAADHAKAVEFYDRTLAVDPDYLYAYYHKAKSLELMGDSEAARDTLQIGLEAAKRAGDDKAISEITEYLGALV